MFSQNIYIENSYFQYNNETLMENSFAFNKSNKKYKNNINFILVELFSKNNVIKREIYELDKSVQNTEIYIDQFNIILKDTVFTSVFIGLDANKKIIDTLYVNNFNASSGLSVGKMSTISLAYSIKKSENKNSNFYKNGLELVPNPSQYYDKEKTKLYYYFELYNEQIKDADSIKFDISIHDQNDVELLKLRRKKETKKIMVETGVVDIKELKNGKYSLYVAAKKNNQIISERKKVFFVGTEIIKANEQESKNELQIELSRYDAQQLQNLLDKFSFLADSHEKTMMKSLISRTDKENFLTRFIEIKLANLNNGISPYSYFISLRERLDLVDKKFGNLRREGYKTDRGKIYLLYGEPSDIERSFSKSDTKPYEIWTYDGIEGSVIFVFGDKTEDGTFELLHSTKRGEINNSEWKSTLQYITR